MISARIAHRMPRLRAVDTLSSGSTRLAAAIASMRSDVPADATLSIAHVNLRDTWRRRCSSSAKAAAAQA